MRSPRALAIAMALAASAPGPARGDDQSVVLHLKTPSSARTDGGTNLRLPPGYFLDETSWAKLDAETRRLQERETRLKAENESLRKSARSISFGWYALAGAFVLGASLGAYAATR